MTSNRAAGRQSPTTTNRTDVFWLLVTGCATVLILQLAAITGAALLIMLGWGLVAPDFGWEPMSFKAAFGVAVLYYALTWRPSFSLRKSGQRG